MSGVGVWRNFGEKMIMSGNGSELTESFGLVIFAGMKNSVLAGSVVRQKLLSCGAYLPRCADRNEWKRRL